jgi:CCR4-NOT transcription complex subunit 2
MKRREPEYQIPACYYINPPLPSPTDKMSLFSDETLFYIFYSMPKDALQLTSAAELYSREWRYHTELQTWFHRIPGNEPIMKTATYERGSYVYFDVSTWTQTLKENFVLEYDKLETLPLKA